MILSPETNHKYRPEIDGLRAVAVLPVLLFHAGIGLFGRSVFRGGYVGVDIFFVLSGYLISGILLDDLAQGRFSLARFYERRARRILPMLLAVILACLPLAWISMDAGQLKDFASSIEAVILFYSNLFFWKKSGYFDAPSGMHPLLHTWSLALEEQFYVLFPFFLVLAWTCVRKHLGTLLLMLMLASLGLAEWASRHYLDANFYLLPTRGWELLVGSLLAYGERRFGRTRQPFAYAWMPALGLALIAFSISYFDDTTRFPSLLTLLPVAGAALVIWSGGHGDLASRALASRGPVQIGLISYSLYLWHQPYLAFNRLTNFGNLSDKRLALYLPACLVGAYVSWRWVEKPFRDPRRIHRRTLVATLAAGTGLVLAFGIITVQQDGFPGRYKMPPALTASFSREASEGTCIDRPYAHVRDDDWYCEIGTPQGRSPRFVLFGDSHAFSMLPAFRAVALRAGTFGIEAAYSGCLPFLGIETNKKDQEHFNCQLLNDRIYQFVKLHKIPTVFLVARWNYYTAWSVLVKNVHEREFSLTSSGRQLAFEKALKRTVLEYAKLGTHVVFLSQVPRQIYDPREVYKYAYLKPFSMMEGILRKRSTPLSTHLEEQAFIYRAFGALSNPFAKFEILDNQLCSDGVCPIGTPSESYYFNSDHLGTAGGGRIESRIEALMHL